MMQSSTIIAFWPNRPIHTTLSQIAQLHKLDIQPTFMQCNDNDFKIRSAVVGAERSNDV